jgi:hypothetical protein
MPSDIGKVQTSFHTYRGWFIKDKTVRDEPLQRMLQLLCVRVFWVNVENAPTLIEIVNSKGHARL